MEMNSAVAARKACLEIEKKISGIDAVINQEKNNTNKTRKTITSARMNLSKEKNKLQSLVVEEAEPGEEE